MDWIKNKLWDLNDVFEEYPRVFRRMMFYLVLAGLATVFYLPFLKGVASFNLMGTYPFYSLIEANIDWLQWGFFAVPAVILFWGWCDADDLYHYLKNKRYRY